VSHDRDLRAATAEEIVALTGGDPFEAVRFAPP